MGQVKQSTCEVNSCGIVVDVTDHFGGFGGITFGGDADCLRLHDR